MPRQGEIAGSATERVIFGTAAAEAVADEAGRLAASRVFVIAGTHLANDTKEIDQVAAALGERLAGVISGIGAHSPKDDILRAAAAAREAHADLLVAIGGGSVMDAGKIVTLCLKHTVTTDEQLSEYRAQFDAQGRVTPAGHAGPEVRVICVPTTLSGAEFNTLSGAYDARLRQKQGFEHRLMAPIAIVLDPAITVHTPQWLWLSTGVRAVDHAVETLVSTYSNDYCNGIAESALRLLADGLPRVKLDPEDLDARLRCQIGAWQSMIPMVSGIPMGASHAIGHILGAVRGVPHGYTSCVMCPAVQQWNASVVPAAHQRIAAALGKPYDPVDRSLDSLIRNLGLPRTLQEVGVDSSDLPRIATDTLTDIWGRTNPRTIRDADDVMEILRLAQAA